MPLGITLTFSENLLICFSGNFFYVIWPNLAAINGITLFSFDFNDSVDKKCRKMLVFYNNDTRHDFLLNTTVYLSG